MTSIRQLHGFPSIQQHTNGLTYVSVHIECDSCKKLIWIWIKIESFFFFLLFSFVIWLYLFRLFRFQSPIFNQFVWALQSCNEFVCDILCISIKNQNTKSTQLNRFELHQTKLHKEDIRIHRNNETESCFKKRKIANNQNKWNKSGENDWKSNYSKNTY